MAVTELAVESDLMPENVASVLVAAGIVTIFVFPLLVRFMPNGVLRRR